MPLTVDSDPVSPPLRDTVQAVSTEGDEPPAIVSISDIHGYLQKAQQALLTLRDHPDFAPVVTADNDGRLHWANENYVLVFNGDLVDRGEENEAVLAMVSRLIDEAPPGRVRVTLGNHEWMIMLPQRFKLSDWFSTKVSAEERIQYVQRIIDGYVIAAYEGHSVTYAHAGSPTAYDVTEVNESLAEAAAEMKEAVGTMEDSTVQSKLRNNHQKVLGTGDTGIKGRGAGLVWLSFDHLDPDSPAQVVGHTRHAEPQTKGNVYCQDLILDNRGSPGGQGVFVETKSSLTAVLRDSEQNVSTVELE